MNNKENKENKENIDNLKNLLKWIIDYENNINNNYLHTNTKLNRYKNMLTNLISEYHLVHSSKIISPYFEKNNSKTPSDIK